jgi:hypothetical protein
LNGKGAPPVHPAHLARKFGLRQFIGWRAAQHYAALSFTFKLMKSRPVRPKGQDLPGLDTCKDVCHVEGSLAGKRQLHTLCSAAMNQAAVAAAKVNKRLTSQIRVRMEAKRARGPSHTSFRSDHHISLITGMISSLDVERLEVTCVLTLPKLLYISFFVLILRLLS